MFIDVKLISGFSKPLTYRVPENWQNILPGTLVRVPLRATRVPALVLRVYDKEPTTAFTLKEACYVEPFPQDTYYLSYLRQLGAHHLVDEVHFIKRMQSFLHEKERTEIFFLDEPSTPKKTVTLTAGQQEIVDTLKPTITNPTYNPNLIHGVTGSGKTEVYKALIAHAFSLKKTTILLLPEVSLAVQFERILKEQLSDDIPVFAFHSAVTPKQKKLLWQHLMQNQPVLIIGVHLPILAPCSNLGLIIIDEEHETGFQEKKHPKINTKHAALLRAQQYQIPIVLGSATPSIASLYNVQHRGWRLFSLQHRFAGKFPTVQVVSLTDKKQRKNFWISNQLYDAIKDRLVGREQTIIFLNRRGVCFFVQCKACSFIFSCHSCSVSLTLHADNTLRCHYCGYQHLQPPSCTKCSGTEFLKKGIGTEQIVTILQKLFPFARIGRADLDATSNKLLWKKTITDFENRELDILVGTQTITKGYHFPHVTLVGAIWADINLNFPFYNAQETTLQQLIQVAGRAGRQSHTSSVIIQTMTDHPLFNHLNEVNYLDFYEQELERRKALSYPPLIRFAEIELKHKKEEVVDQEAQQCAATLMRFEGITVLGPAQPPVARIKTIVSRKMYLKAHSFAILQKAFSSLDQKKYKSALFFTPDPLN